MLPTRLNLLSPSKKLFLRRLLLVQFSRHLMELVLLLVALVCIMFLGGEWALESYFADIVGSHTLVVSEHSKINQEIHSLNNSLFRLEILQKNSRPWSDKVINLMNVIPVGISLNSAHFSQNGSIVLTGKATDRTTLLALKESLGKLPTVQQVLLPASNLTERENIDFSLTIETK